MERTYECLLTGLTIDGKINQSFSDGIEIYWYVLTIGTNRLGLSICSSLYSQLKWPESDISKYLNKHRSLLIGELAKDGFQSLNRKVFHNEGCEKLKNERHVYLKKFIEDIIEKADFPKSKQEKFDLILNYLFETQAYDGEEILIKQTIDFYGKFYLSSFAELEFYLREMKAKDLIRYFEDENKIQFTINGLEHVDKMSKAKENNISINDNGTFDIALSFAGEDRNYVELVAEKLKEQGVKVFYDKYEEVELWGKDLYQHLNEVYSKKSRYCIVFISSHYAAKLWTRHELKSAQAKAFREFGEYILPARFDLTELPGMNDTVGYIDCKKISPGELALLAVKKLLK